MLYWFFAAFFSSCKFFLGDAFYQGKEVFLGLGSADRVHGRVLLLWRWVFLVRFALEVLLDADSGEDLFDVFSSLGAHLEDSV